MTPKQCDLTVLFFPNPLSRVLLYLGSILTSLLFLVVNLTCAMLIHGEVPQDQLRWTVLARALVNDSLFILCAISLACCMCKLGKMSSANVYLESKVGKRLLDCPGLLSPELCAPATGITRPACFRGRCLQFCWHNRRLSSCSRFSILEI